MKTFLKFYNVLGNSKAQRFRRFMIIVSLIVALIGFGFYSGALKVSFSKDFTTEEKE